MLREIKENWKCDRRARHYHSYQGSIVKEICRNKNTEAK